MALGITITAVLLSLESLIGGCWLVQVFSDAELILVELDVVIGSLTDMRASFISCTVSGFSQYMKRILEMKYIGLVHSAIAVSPPFYHMRICSYQS